jgi:hypothetical protein
LFFSSSLLNSILNTNEFIFVLFFISLCTCRGNASGMRFDFNWVPTHTHTQTNTMSLLNYGSQKCWFFHWRVGVGEKVDGWATCVCVCVFLSLSMNDAVASCIFSPATLSCRIYQVCCAWCINVKRTWQNSPYPSHWECIQQSLSTYWLQFQIDI